MLTPVPDGLRLALGLLTAVRVRTPARLRPAAAMAWAPVVGLLLGAAAAAALLAIAALTTGPLLPAVAAVATLAVLTRGLHLDGLADLADGLGSGRRRDEALAVMRRSDVGPFGVATLALVLLTQVGALASCAEPARAVLVAAVAGRLALPWACGPRVPAARPEGLGALVAGRVPVGAAAALTAAALAVSAVVLPVWHGPAAILAGLATAAALRRHAVRRLGGVTGDVLGALVEAATTAALVAAAAAHPAPILT